MFRRPTFMTWWMALGLLVIPLAGAQEGTAAKGPDPSPARAEGAGDAPPKPDTGRLTLDLEDPATMEVEPPSIQFSGGLRLGFTRFEGNITAGVGGYLEARARVASDWFVFAQYAHTSCKGSSNNEEGSFLWLPAEETEISEHYSFTDAVGGIGLSFSSSQTVNGALLAGGGVRWYEAKRREITTDLWTGKTTEDVELSAEGHGIVGTLQVHVGYAPTDWLDLGGGVYMDGALLNGYRDEDRFSFSLGLRAGITIRF
jgi:hypothetical protein